MDASRSKGTGISGIETSKALEYRYKLRCDAAVALQNRSDNYKIISNIKHIFSEDMSRIFLKIKQGSMSCFVIK
ncbi:hypothetical protein NY78_2782 [Desulfovibrio sp. TomC]|nr:hypothetical protein NY78_2782 [Desulfovibrio sp. TomC]